MENKMMMMMANNLRMVNNLQVECKELEVQGMNQQELRHKDRGLKG